MRVTNLIFIIIVFFLVALLQNSFLPYFSILGQTPHFLLILFFLLVSFQKPQEYLQGFFLVALVGFFMDVFLPYHFGFSIVTLLLLYVFIKLSDYFFKKSQNSYEVVYFLTIFTIGFLLHEVIFYIFSKIFGFSFEIQLTIIISLIYNIIFAAIGFYLYKNFISRRRDNQLKLF